MGCNFVTDNARSNILFVRKTEVLLWSDVAQHRGPIPPDLGSTNCACDVIVTRGDVSDQRPERIEGSVKTMAMFLDHIFPDALHRYVAGTFNHHLYIMCPGAFRQLSECAEFGELGFIIGVIN